MVGKYGLVSKLLYIRAGHNTRSCPQAEREARSGLGKAALRKDSTAGRGQKASRRRKKSFFEAMQECAAQTRPMNGRTKEQWKQRGQDRFARGGPGGEAQGVLGRTGREETGKHAAGRGRWRVRPLPAGIWCHGKAR